jgi:hypothetical protein
MGTFLFNVLTLAGSTFLGWLIWTTLESPARFLAMGPLGLAMWTLRVMTPRRRPPVAVIGAFAWDQDAFCRGWSITGSTGSGKTASALMTLAHQLFQRSRNWGGIIIDPKCVLWEAFQAIARRYGRSGDFINLAVRPDNASPGWKPVHRYNLLSYPGIPWTTYAKIIVDTAGSLGQSSDKGFFRTQAQIHMAKGLEALELAGLPVTLRRLYQILSLDDELDIVIELLARRARDEALATIRRDPTKYAALRKRAADAKGENFRNRMLENPSLLVSDFDPEVADQELLQWVPDPATFIEYLDHERDIPEAWRLCVHFIKNLREQPDEQLGGVKSTIFNYLQYFTSPDIADVFCAENNTFDFSDVDRGKFLCVSMPQKYQTERNYIFTFLKLLFYTHALRRFDKPKAQREHDNLIVFIADEAQNVVTAADDGMADYNVVDKIREARATVIFATQSTTSYLPALKDPNKVKVLLLNLKNQIYYQLADPEAARLAAEIIGKRRIWKRSYSRSQRAGGAGANFSQQDEYWMRPEQLTALKKFDCVVLHPERGWQRLHLPPLDERGRISAKYLQDFIERNHSA